MKYTPITLLLLVTISALIYAQDIDLEPCEYIPNLSIEISELICDEELIILDAGDGFDSYSWSTDETSQTITVSESGNYSVEVENYNNNTNSIHLANSGEWTNSCGNGGWIDCGNELNLNGSFSIGGWIYRECENVTFMSKRTFNPYKGFNLDFTNGYTGFYIHDENSPFDVALDQNPPTPLNEWTHVVGVFEAENYVSLYINGELVGYMETDATGSVNTNSYPLIIGGHTNGNENNYNEQPIQWVWGGSLDNIFIYSKALSATEIDDIYNNNNMPSENLEALWDFEEVNTTQVIDQSGNNNNGIIYGGTYDSNNLPFASISTGCIDYDEISVDLNLCGCTDITACNYNELATENDESCEYIEVIIESNEITCNEESITLTATGDNHDYYVWSLNDENISYESSITINQEGNYSVEVGNLYNNMSNSSLNFSANDVILIDQPFSGNQSSFSICAWVYPESNNNLPDEENWSNAGTYGDSPWGSIYHSRSHYNDHYLNLEGSTYSDETNTMSVRFGLADGDQISGEGVNIGQWNYIVGTFDGEVQKLYINGVLSNSSNQVSESINWDNNCWTAIGGDGNYSASNCSGAYTALLGKLDDVQVWNIALTDIQIEEYSNCPETIVGDEVGLIQYFNFEEGEGVVVNNLVSNNSQSILGPEWSNNTPSCSVCIETDMINIIFDVCGCTDETACNYNPEAIEEDGSCCYDNLHINVTGNGITCEESLVLDAGEGYNSYLWSTGDTSQTITVDSSGSYSVETSTICNNESINNYSMYFNNTCNSPSCESEDYIDLGNSSDFNFSNSPFTMMCWVKVIQSRYLDGIITKEPGNNQGWWLIVVGEYFGEGVIDQVAYGGWNDEYFGLSSQTNNTNSTWTHIAVTHDKSEQKFYMNGELTESGTFEEYVVNSTSNLLIGKKEGDTGLEGYVDEVSIWNIALSKEEIQEYKECSPFGPQNGMVGCYNFEEGPETGQVIDSSGNNNHGEINGNPEYSNDVPIQNCQTCEYEEIDGFTYLGSFEQSNYYISNTQNSWNNANNSCNATEKGNLVIIESELENQFIVEQLLAYGTPAPGIWIGLSQLGTGNEDNACTNWEWVNGTPLIFNGNLCESSNNENWVGYSNWNSPEPNDNNDEDHGHLWMNTGNVENGTWNDANDSMDLPVGLFYILETECLPTCISTDSVEVIINICGCTDETACNYDESATEDDGSCEDIEEIEGFYSPQYYNGNYYYVSYSTYSWVDANQICNDLGGDLLIIDNIDEQNFIVNNNPSTGNFWMGLYQNTNSSSFSEPLGGWEWLNGDAMSYSNWDPNNNEPNNQSIWGNSNYGVFQSNGTWNDAPNEYGPGFQFIMEFSCLLIEGCTDENACNYNELATENDGSCEYLNVVIEGDNETCEESITLTTTGEYDSYQWFLEGEIMAGETSESITIYDSGVYSVEVENLQSNIIGNGYSMDFLEGEFACVEIPNSNSLNPEEGFTISFWAKINQLDCCQHFFNKWIPGNVQFIFSANSSGLYSHIGGDGTNNEEFIFQSTLQPEFNEWQYISMSHDPNQCLTTFYVGDGEQLNSTSESGNCNNLEETTHNIHIGGNPNFGSSDSVEGLMDNVQFWNKVLSIEEIENYMICPPTGNENELIGYWNFEEGPETGQVIDSSGNNNHGEINGNPEYSNDVPIQNCQTCEYEEIDGFIYGGYFEGSHYYISEETSTWSEANENINELGYGHFVTITSEEENSFLTEMINLETFLPYTLYGSNPSVWIGLYQDCPNNDECETNQTGWQWMNGEEIVYTNWFCGDTGPGCPGSTTEDVGILWSTPSGTWNDGLFNSGGELVAILEFTCQSTCASTDEIDITFNICGCMDEAACNYNPEATEESDDSCEYLSELLIESSEITCDETITLTSIGGDYDTYQWYLNDVILEGETNSTIEVYESGNYSIEVYNSNYSNYYLDCTTYTDYDIYGNGSEAPYDNDYVQINNNINPTQQITIMGWIKISEDQQRTFIQKCEMSDNKIWLLGTGSQSKIAFYVHTNDSLEGTWNWGDDQIQYDVWHHIAATYDGSTMKTYINGILNIDERELTGNILESSAFTYFGDPIGGGGYMDGYMDDFSVWGIALSIEEINEYMNCSPIGNENGLLAAWNFEEESENIISDLTNNHDGNIISVNTEDITQVNGDYINHEIEFSNSDIRSGLCETIYCSTISEINIEIDICGCMDETACNYNENATDDDGSCEYNGDVCFFIVDNDCCCCGSCDCVCESQSFLTPPIVCESIITSDESNSNIIIPGFISDCECIPTTILGCIDNTACNYNPFANTGDSSCIYPEEYYNCDGVCINDSDSDTTCDELEIEGCTDENSCNYNEDATDDNNSCLYIDGICDTCWNGLIIDNDMDDDGICDNDEIIGCIDDQACNYDNNATDSCNYDPNCCLYEEEYYDCNEVCLNDSDLDGICDELEIAGCQDQTACDYNYYATDPCEYGDTFGFNWCCQDYTTCIGCQDEMACNFDENATIDNGICFTYDCNGVCGGNAQLDDCGVCQGDNSSCSGCMDELANNFNPNVIIDNETCLYSPFIYGCTDETMLNYNPNATTDDGSCCGFFQIGQDILGESEGDRHGQSVSISNDGGKIAIGTPSFDGYPLLPDNGSNSGCVKIYNYNESVQLWEQLGNTILGETSEMYTGKSMELSGNGNVVAISSPWGYNNNGEQSGYVRLYEYNETEQLWEIIGFIDGENAGDGFGQQIALSDDGYTIAITAPNHDGSGGIQTGHVKVFTWGGIDWDQVGFNIDGENQYDAGTMGSGKNIDLSGDGNILAIGNQGNDDNGEDAGHVRIYERNIDNTEIGWDQLGSDIDGAYQGARFGYSVSLNLDGSRLAVGSSYNEMDIYGCCSGFVEVYEYSNNNEIWNQLGSTLFGEDIYTPEWGSSHFGESVSLNSNGNVLAVGASEGIGGGLVEIYNLNNSEWEQIGNEIYEEIDFNAANYGESIQLNSLGNIIVIGAPDSDLNGYLTGQVSVYNLELPCDNQGCTDQNALNFDAYAEQDNGLCIYPLEGCLDELACNYNPYANIDNETCIYPDLEFNCNGLPYQCGDVIYNFDGPYNFNGNSFYISQENNYEWNQANDIVQVYGFYLATINSEDENNFIQNIIPYEENFTGYMIGLYQNNNSSTYSEPSGGWEWTTGEPLNVEFWDITTDPIDPEPTNTGQIEDFSEIFQTGLWNDIKDNTSRPFIMECGSLFTITGCTDETAFNYDNTANIDDGSCVPIVEGCTDETAFNYDNTANIDDGSCIPVIEGCLDSTACNYNISANINCWIEDEEIEGFTYINSFEGNSYYVNNTGFTWQDANSLANSLGGYLVSITSQEEQEFIQNMLENNPTIFNWDGYWIGLNDIDSEGDFVWTSNEELNFVNWFSNNEITEPNNDNGQAHCVEIYNGNIGSTMGFWNDNECDGSYNQGTYNQGFILEIESCCIYSEDNFDCEGNCLETIDCNGNCSSNEPLSINLSYDSSITCYPNGFNWSANGGSPFGTESPWYEFEIFNIEAQWLWSSGGSQGFSSSPGIPGTYLITVTDANGCSISEEFIFGDINCLGCTDESACNYDPAGIDPGDNYLCDYSCLGCIDENACNYDPSSTLDNGSCDYSCIGCTDTEACNYDPNATIEDNCYLNTNSFVCNENYLSLDNFSLPTNSSTISMWIKRNSSTNTGVLMNINSGSGAPDEATGVYQWQFGCGFSGGGGPGSFNYGYVVGESGSIQTNPIDVNSDDLEILEANEWYYITMVFNNGLTHLYINAELERTVELASDNVYALPGSSLYLGYDGYSNNSYFNYFDGNIDQVEIWDTALTATEIASLKDCSPTGNENGLIAYWNFNNSINDISNNNYNLTAIGSVLYSEETPPQDCLIECCIYPQELYDCNNNCLNDINNNNICDELEISGCTDSNALNFNPLATENNNLCCYVNGCTDTEADNYNSTACLDNNSCLYLGCTDENAPNYDPNANEDLDGLLCINLDLIEGCTDENAINYCEDCVNSCLDCCWIPGCLDPLACDYNENPNANFDVDGELCTYPEEYYDCSDICLNDIDSDGICDELEVLGCTNFLYEEYNPLATEDDNSCLILSLDGCMDENACNYNEFATEDDGSCYNNNLGCGCDNPAADDGYDCNSNCLVDTDSDGVCDQFEIIGCTDINSCNYNVTATDDGLCTYPINDCTDCDGNILGGLDCAGICNGNYLEDNCGNCDDDPSNDCTQDCSGIWGGDAIIDECGICGGLNTSGCTDTNACNYDSGATCSNNDCIYPEQYYDCLGNCISNLDCNGTCGGILIIDNCGVCGGNNSCFGCTNEDAANYNPEATISNGTCCYNSGCTDPDANNYNPDACYDDETCIYCSVTGCTDPDANNYNPDACYDDETCEYEVADWCTYPASQIIENPAGWSLFSTYLCLENNEIEVVLEEYINEINIVKDQNGGVWWPLFELMSLQDNGAIVPGEGYQIKLNNAVNFELSGTKASYLTPIISKDGWSFIGTLNSEEYPVEDIIEDYYNNTENALNVNLDGNDFPVSFEIIKDETGGVYWPTFGLNSLHNSSQLNGNLSGTFRPGEGYQLKQYDTSNESLTWFYNDLSGNGRYGNTQNNIKIIGKNFTKPINTGNNMTLGILSSAWKNTPKEGDEIIVYDQNKMIVGYTLYREEGTVVTIWGDDELTDKKDGLFIGEKFIIKLFRVNNHFGEKIKIHKWEQGSEYYSINGISVASSLSQEIIQEKKIVKITDILGREINPNSKKSTLIYIYDDGTIERKYILD